MLFLGGVQGKCLHVVMDNVHIHVLKFVLHQIYVQYARGKVSTLGVLCCYDT